jgi:hypothetical protein
VNSMDGNLILMLNRVSGSRAKLLLPDNTARTINRRLEANGHILEPVNHFALFGLLLATGLL